MPIQPLSEETSRILTSTLTLNNATSVIKELIENALDARASSISIEIAENTLDKIIVKDNGFGIGVEDRQLLCKRGYTSKITDLDDLANLGGTFLGFRGTALASIAKLSKEVMITTKVDGEKLGTMMTFDSNGMSNSASASHNDGTTIRIEKFLVSLPVREQFALSNPSKVLNEIKRLLMNFAVARLTVKLSLKVLKAKNDKSNWSFAECKGGDLMSAAIQVVGKSIASLCQYHTLEPNESESENHGYSVRGLLLDVTHNDVTKAGSVGQYISVDGRLVTQEKGIMKEMVKSYKTHLSHAAAANKAVPSKPFLIIHIKCPRGSYDVNVEPTKDVLLFHNEDKVFNLVEKLFARFYGSIEQQESSKPKSSKTSQNLANHGSFNVLLARKTPQNPITGSASCSNETQNDVNDAPVKKRSLIEDFTTAVNEGQSRIDVARGKVQLEPENTAPISETRHDMYFVDEEEELNVTTTENSDHVISEEEDYDPNNIQINNPFVRAKVSSIQHSRRDFNEKPQISHKTIVQQRSPRNLLSSSPTVNPPIASHRVSLGSVHHPPTPETSPNSRLSEPYQNPGPPFPRRNRHVHDDDDDGVVPDLNDPEQSRRTPRSKQSVLVGWAQTPLTDNGGHVRTATDIMRTTDQIGSRSLQSLDSPRNERHRENLQKPSRSVTKPFISPIKSGRARAPPPANEPADCSTQQLHLSELSPPESHSRFEDDLQYVLDFEYRKKAVNQQRRSNKTILKPTDVARVSNNSDAGLEDRPATNLNSEAVPVAIDTAVIPGTHPASTIQESLRRQNPHHNRYLAAIRGLEARKESSVAMTNDHELGSLDQTANMNTIIQMDTNESSSIRASDPRGYLIYHNRLISESNSSKLKTKRLKSSQLPFESILPDVVKHNLLATPTESFPQLLGLHASVNLLVQYDPYVTTGRIEPLVWSPAGREVMKWQNTLHDLVRNNHHAKASIEHESTGEPETIPTISINLITALKAHIDSL